MNLGPLASRDPAQNITNRRGTRERRAASGGHVKLAKAVKEIAAPGLPQLGADPVVRPGQRLLGPQTAVQGHLGLANPEQCDEQHAAPEQQRTEESSL